MGNQMTGEGEWETEWSGDGRETQQGRNTGRNNNQKSWTRIKASFTPDMHKKKGKSTFFVRSGHVSSYIGGS